MKSDWFSPGTFRVNAYEYGNDEYVIDVSMYLDDEGERDAVAAKFPKYVKVKRSTLSGQDGRYGQPGFESWTIPTAVASFRFRRDGSTGDFNEAAAKRWDAFKRVARENGYNFEMRKYSTNSIPADDPRVGLTEKGLI